MNTTSSSLLNIEAIQQTQSLINERRDYLTELLLESGVFSDTEAIDIAASTMSAWYEMLCDAGVDDVNGISLSIDMLPPHLKSHEVVEYAVRNIHAGLPINRQRYIAMCWYQLRGDLMNDMFKDVSTTGRVDLTMTLGHTLWMVPDNDDSVVNPIRLFSTKAAAELYCRNGDAKWAQ